MVTAPKKLGVLCLAKVYGSNPAEFVQIGNVYSTSKFPLVHRQLGRKFTVQFLYENAAVSTNETAPPRPIDGNPTFDLEQCSMYCTFG
jgi:hypothetical protein